MTRFENIEVFIWEKVWIEPNIFPYKYNSILKRSHSSYLPAYEDERECSETSEYKIQTPGNYPEESVQYSEHGESLKSRKILGIHWRLGEYTVSTPSIKYRTKKKKKSLLIQYQLCCAHRTWTVTRNFMNYFLCSLIRNATQFRWLYDRNFCQDPKQNTSRSCFILQDTKIVMMCSDTKVDGGRLLSIYVKMTLNSYPWRHVTPSHGSRPEESFTEYTVSSERSLEKFKFIMQNTRWKQALAFCDNLRNTT
jgi:hypothetical protein